MIPYRLWIYRLLTSWLPETRFFAVKALLLRWCGAKVGKNVRINSSAKFLGCGGLEIGDDVWIGAGGCISSVGSAVVKIEKHCDLGPEVMVLTGTHDIDPDGDHIGAKGRSESVSIGPGCWLGARSTILPGVGLSAKTLVAAGSVVTKSFDADKIMVAGIPAVIKKRYKP